MTRLAQSLAARLLVACAFTVAACDARVRGWP